MTPGRLLAGRFECDGIELGSGRMGVVWSAVDKGTGRDVAIKVLHPNLLVNPLARERLKVEAGVAAQLRHPSVVEVLGLWEDEGQLLLVSERVHGRSLADVQGPLDLDRALWVGLQVAEALHAAHTSTLVHGDVRPGNVLLGDVGAKLFDFGLAAWVASLEPADAAHAATLRPGHTAPEVLDGAPASVASDLYGLGVVLVVALTGRLPFSGESAFALMADQRSRQIALTSVPAGVAALVVWLLQAEPDRRPGDARTVAIAIRRLQRWPGHPLVIPMRLVPPIRPRKAWVVHGIDPLTGARSLVRAGLNRRAAYALSARLSLAGWEVDASRDGLELKDLAWIAAGAAAGSFFVAPIGTLLGAACALHWRRQGVRPQLRSALPTITAKVPEELPADGSEGGVTVGLLLLGLAASLVFWPPAALPLALYLGVLSVSAWRSRQADPAQLALTGRVETALAEVEVLVEQHRGDLDAQLALQGELNQLEKAWRMDAAPPRQLIDDIEALGCRARIGTGEHRPDEPKGPVSS
jgi:hypothetical protein